MTTSVYLCLSKILKYNKNHPISTLYFKDRNRMTLILCYLNDIAQGGTHSKRTISIHRSLATPDVFGAILSSHTTEISIHRSLATPDKSILQRFLEPFDISIHRSLATPDSIDEVQKKCTFEFQSTGVLRLLTYFVFLIVEGVLIFQSTGVLRLLTK